MRVDIREKWAGKNIAVIGLGISNIALIKFLKTAGANISARDRKKEEQFDQKIEILKALDIELILGEHYLDNLTDYDVVMVSPGVPKDLPELQEVAKLGLLDSEIGLVFSHSKAPLYGITGSSGKTTTTSLVGEMLKLSNIPVYVGGNIGTPVITKLNDFTSRDRIVLELSSFQLENLQQSPRGALITNIAENHLDIHGTMENYINAKRNIYLQQKPTDFLVVNYDDPETRKMGQESTGEVVYFSLKEKLTHGAYLANNNLIYANNGVETVFSKRSDLVLPGLHNVANFLAAAVFSHKIGASWEAIRKVGKTFSGVSHRLEFVAEIDGVKYYNDSIATTPDRTLAALNSFNEPIVLIAGGSDKELSFKTLADGVHKYAKHLILFGATAPKIKKEVLKLGDFPLQQVENLQEAVIAASRLAKSGEIIILSPACASFDQYDDFIARGDHFRKLVQNLHN